jgi:hypothetical protein
MKTAVTEILEHCKELISEGYQIDTQGLVHWIEDKLLEIEKQYLIETYNKGRSAGVGDYVDIEWGRDVTELTAEQYYNETFKS